MPEAPRVRRNVAASSEASLLLAGAISAGYLALLIGLNLRCPGYFARLDVLYLIGAAATAAVALVGFGLMGAAGPRRWVATATAGLVAGTLLVPSPTAVAGLVVMGLAFRATPPRRRVAAAALLLIVAFASAVIAYGLARAVSPELARCG